MTTKQKEAVKSELENWREVKNFRCCPGADGQRENRGSAEGSRVPSGGRLIRRENERRNERQRKRCCNGIQPESREISRVNERRGEAGGSLAPEERKHTGEGRSKGNLAEERDGVEKVERLRRSGRRPHHQNSQGAQSLLLRRGQGHRVEG